MTMRARTSTRPLPFIAALETDGRKVSIPSTSPTVCMLSKRTEEAARYFERALAIHREVGDRRSEG